MQEKDKMHPQDMRNLMIFGVLSILLWLSYDHFILGPKTDAIRAAQMQAKQQAITAQVQSGMAGEDTERPRADVVTEGDRFPIKSEKVFGSINLTGARLDDLSLVNYHKTVERDDHVSILSPVGSPYPKYFESGWVATDKNLKMPDPKTKWTVVDGNELTPETPVHLRWSNGQGLVFEQVISLDKDFAFTVARRVLNNTGVPVTIHPYTLIAQRGTPEDFLHRWVVHEGPIGYFDKSLVEKAYDKMAKEPVVEETAYKGWIGLTSKDWLTAIVPDQASELPSKYRMTYTKAALDKAKDRFQTDVMGPEFTVQSGGMAEVKTNLFAGAKVLSLIEKYEKQWDMPHFDLTVDFGWFYFLTRPFFSIIHFFYGFVGNFGVAIILFTVCLRICVFPLANTSFKSFAKMRKIGPEMQELRDKHNDDKQKLQQELIKLYQKEKVNPMAGCLPILIQIPIFFSLFKVLSNTIEMRHAPFFGWIQDLSAPDPTSVFNLFGLIPFDPPSFMMIGAWPCMMLVTMIIQRKLSPPPTDKFQAQLIAAMPWVMTFVLAQFAAGLVIYWTFNNLFSVIQQYIIMRNMGVKVDLIGNIFGRNKQQEVTPIEGVHVEVAMVEHKIEEALGIDEKDTPENAGKPVTKPKPKKSKKKK